jgi:pimeloyl-ACP methyl ester carboxylesterase
MSLMPGFEARYVRANGTRLHAWVGGQGSPVVLLHGYPQSGIMWRKVAPTLARDHTVVCPDLRG